MTGTEIAAEHARGASLSAELLSLLLQQRVDVAMLCRRVERGTPDPPRLDRFPDALVVEAVS